MQDLTNVDCSCKPDADQITGGRYRRKRQPMSTETRERIRARLLAFYSNPDNRSAAVKRMASQAVRDRISEGTRVGLAKRVQP